MLIKVKAYPQSEKDEVVKVSDDSFKVSVREAPVKGKANRAIIRVLAKFLGIPAWNIKIVKGFRERNKIIDIKNETNN